MTEIFESHRSLLFAIAYRMLGSATDAEDILQEAYLRFMSTPQAEIRSPKALLSTIVTRLCLDQLKSARVKRESYVGPWLPEPIHTADAVVSERVEQYESISLAFLVLLESLNPLERAVFLLREVFDYDYNEIAQMVDKSEVNCRQIYHRAQEYVRAHRPRFQATPEAHRKLLDSFIQAVGTGDLPGLTSLLAEGITVWSDGGGKVRAATRPVQGRDAVARFILGISRHAPAGLIGAVEEINGTPAIVLRAGRQVNTVLVVESDGEQIHTLRFMVNPDKLGKV